MAHKPHVIANEQREARQKLYNAAPVVGSIRGVEEASVALKFRDPEGKQNPAPRGHVFLEEMHAFFEFTCPLRDCEGGGFDANEDLLRALNRRRDGHTGTLTCKGTRPRNGDKKASCDIELNYTLTIRAKSAAAA